MSFFQPQQTPKGPAVVANYVGTRKGTGCFSEDFVRVTDP